MNGRVYWLVVAVGLVLLAPGGVQAQPAPLPSIDVIMHVDSGEVSNNLRGGADAAVVFSTIVNVDDAPWLRLRFGEVQLSGSPPKGTGSFLRITSLEDGGVQYLDAVSVAQWRYASAYFNGDRVRVELLAYPNTGPNRVTIGQVTAGIRGAEGGPCQPVDPDNREPVASPAHARVLTTCCVGTAFLINDEQHCFLTAGHVADPPFEMLVVQFNVPPSNPDGTINCPLPQYQFAIDQASIQLSKDSMIGNDWCYFGAFPNPNTGLTPYQEQGLSMTLATTVPPPDSDLLVVTGYGADFDDPERNFTLQTENGIYDDEPNETTIFFDDIDIQGGNSGSALIKVGSGLVIGITTHCNVGGGPTKAATRIDNPGLQAALANPQGVCAGGKQQGNYISIGDIEWQEVGGDGDGVPECGESADAQIWLCSTANVDFVQATLYGASQCVDIYDAEQDYGSIAGGACVPSIGSGFSMNIVGCSCNTSFALALQYEIAGVPYEQVIFFWHYFHDQGEVLPTFQTCGFVVVVDDCNGDGVLNSGESAEIRIAIKNTGSATAIHPDVWLSCVDGIELDCGYDIRYPDLLPDGPCEWPELKTAHWNLYIPPNVEGTFYTDINITYNGANEPFVIPDGLQITVQPQGWIQLNPQTHDFGATGTDEDVVLPVSIDNYGSAPMEVPVDGIVPSHPDTSWSGPSLPWTIDPGSSQEITVTIETDKMGCEPIERWIDVISDACVEDPNEDNRVVITGMVCDAWPVFELPVTTAVSATHGMDVSGTLMVWQDDRNPPPGHDIYAFDIPTGEEFEALVALGHQSTAKIGGSLLAWNDDSDGDLEFDVWARFLPDGDPFPVANSTMDERLVGVSGNLIAFSRVYYEFPPNGNEPDPRNMYLYDASTGETEPLTSCFHDGFKPMCTVSLPGDFGGCLLVWNQFLLVWDGDNWKQQDRKLVIYDVCQGVERDEILDSILSGPSTNNGKVVWCATDAGNDDQVYLWQNGEVTQITSGEADHEWPEVGDDLIVYRKFLAGPDAMVYWDLSTGQEVLIMLTDTPDERWRMDGNVLALRLYGPPRLYYAFLNEADISVNPEGISFSNDQPYADEEFDVSVQVNNIAPLGTSEDITVELYDGHPDDSEPLDSATIGGMAGQTQEVVTFTGVVINTPGIYDICIRVVVPSGDNPANNIACKALEVLAPGACCFQDGTCDEATTPAQCAVAGGFYQGDGSACPPDGCPVEPRGACCLADDTCVDWITQAACIAAAGTYHGDGSDCASIECDQCPWDLDGNNDVGVKDLLILLGAWGPCPPKGGCPADFDGNGDVAVKDLLVLLGVWGPCP